MPLHGATSPSPGLLARSREKATTTFNQVDQVYQVALLYWLGACWSCLHVATVPNYRLQAGGCIKCHKKPWNTYGISQSTKP